MSNVLPFPEMQLARRKRPTPMRASFNAHPAREAHSFRQTNCLQHMAARWSLRKMLRDELLPQPDSVLADAGWTRTDLVREIAKPFWRA
ncbi:DUF1127 domain-containing protein [Rhizobium sp. SG2393]|uniref:DUF1127 domain-containing protein n=1 Tax=Rhizobium sp. SG2393 TaxID=3276279 RepID=UPI003670EC4C